MSQRITIDPVTRIEGHLRIDCEIENGVVSKAWASGTMWRGMEEIVKNRDPRDAWMIVQRICGVCTTTHALSSVRAAESALNIDVPVNAQYIRNIILAAHTTHDHIVHFYQLSALDWVDITSALQADPTKASEMLKGVSTWHLNSPEEFTKVQNKIKDLVASGQLGIFANGYWGHPAMKLPPEVNLIAVAHYLQALECQRDANRVVALLGGKTPHIQNLAVGGVANPINLDGLGVLNLERLMYIKSFIDKLSDFVEQVYKVDTAVIAAFYPEWLTRGKGAVNYLSVPEFPTDSKNGSTDERPDQLVAMRVYMDGRLIVSTRQRKVLALDDVVSDLEEGTGPTDCGGWLVDVCDALTDHSSEFIEQLHDKIIDLEDNLLDQQIPPRGFLALLRKQLIVMRRYMAPQRDVYARLASERLPWMSDDQRRRMQDIADRLGRGLDEIDACIARTGVMADEIAQVMQENLARRTYTMSLMAMVFLPSTFLTGLFGVNLGGIPGGGWQFGFSIFCILLVVLIGGVALWLHRSKWL